MSLPRAHTRYSTEEYLALERESEERHEYLDGQIYAMAGDSPEHGAICTNLIRIISTQLLGSPCQVFSKDMKVRSGAAPKLGQTAKGLYSYPDLLVVCGELKFHDEHRDVLLNPAVIIEVLSPPRKPSTVARSGRGIRPGCPNSPTTFWSRRRSRGSTTSTAGPKASGFTPW
jgi:Uma2 family endonuclease